MNYFDEFRDDEAIIREVEQRGAMRERDRIIALLEKHTGYGDEEWDSDVNACIALIKGENK